MSRLLKVDLYSHLQSIDAITDLVGDRIFGVLGEHKPDLPYARYQTISSIHDSTHDGQDELKVLRLQFDSFSEDPDEAEAVDDAIEAALLAFRNFEGLFATIGFVRKDNERGPEYEEDTKLYRFFSDYMIQYKATDAPGEILDEALYTAGDELHEFVHTTIPQDFNNT